MLDVSVAYSAPHLVVHRYYSRYFEALLSIYIRHPVRKSHISRCIAPPAKPVTESSEQNWRDELEYDVDLSPHSWAWEFLRRNHGYRRDFATLTLLQKQWGATERDLNYHLELWHCEPAAAAGESYANWKHRAPHQRRRVPLYRHYAQRYGLRPTSSLPNPARRATAGFFPALFDKAEPGFLHDQFYGLGEVEVHWRLREWGEVAIFFDARENIKKQIRRAEEFLQSIQEKNVSREEIFATDGRRTRESLRDYLRILDAFEGNVDDEAIARTLYAMDRNGKEYVSYPDSPRERRYQTARDEAIYLRDKGWLELARQSSLQPKS